LFIVISDLLPNNNSQLPLMSAVVFLAICSITQTDTRIVGGVKVRISGENQKYSELWNFKGNFILFHRELMETVRTCSFKGIVVTIIF